MSSESIPVTQHEIKEVDNFLIFSYRSLGGDKL